MPVVRAFLLLLALIVVAPGPGMSQGTASQAGSLPSPDAQIDQWDAEAGRIEKELEQNALDSQELDRVRAAIEQQRGAIRQLIDPAQAEVDPLRKQLDALGKAPEDPALETTEVKAERERLASRIAAYEARLKRLNQADARATALLGRLSALRRELFTRELLTRGPSPLDPGVIARAVGTFGAITAAIWTETAERIVSSTMDAAFFLRTVVLPALFGAALFLLLGAKAAVLRRLQGAVAAGSSLGQDVLAAVGVSIVRLIIPTLAVALAFFAAWNSGLLGPQGESLLFGLSATAMVVIGAYALSGAYYSPHAPLLRISKLPEEQAVKAHRWLMTLALIVGLDRVLVVRLDQMGIAIDMLVLLNSGLLVAGGVAVLGFARFISGRVEPALAEGGTGPSEPADDEAPAGAATRDAGLSAPLLAGARVLARVVAVVAPALALMGYFAASRHFFYPVVFSGVVLGFCVLLFHSAREIVDRVAEPQVEEGGDQISRIRLIPILVGFLLTCGAVPVLALIWGADFTDLVATWRAFSDGFKVGDVTIAPFDFFSFLLVFSVGYVLTRMVQGVISRSVLPLTRMDAGGRAAVSAGIFYLGVILSALVAISTTGLDLSNLAIVAGALSVGIGFGLQNIVNNFVSGIILLIERPIKAGDWVELGSGTGYVRRVNVRSTEIETFDRASLIVPNSELISGPVTNWTHTNLNGRIIVPVGVAYGTDPRKVETILTEIAKAHPMLLRRPTPYVLFRRFGADALEFEIRGVLRDVNWILNVTSDINFEISRRFADAGIEIPFAQRDLHLRNAGDVGRSIGDAIRGAAEEADPPARLEQTQRRPPQRPEAAGNEPDGDT